MSDLDKIPWDATTAPSGTGAEGRRCRRHVWWMPPIVGPLAAEWHFGADGWVCRRCRKPKDATRSRRARNNGKRGRTAELEVARMVGGRKVGPLGLPWDVELAGYARLQVKKLKSWPSLNEIIGWLDAIPSAPELRGVVVVEAAGQGKHGRSVIVFDVAEWARWHGGKP